jgi:tetraacyldisaccharide 4'-kinase
VTARASVESALRAAWQRRGALAWLLLPLSLLYRAALALRRAAYAIGLRRSNRVGVPVLVVGNVYVGGTGKTPLTIELVRALRQRGWHPGVVSRGYGGGAAPSPRLVQVDHRADEVGDEPLLIARATGARVAVDANRAAAASALLQAEPECDVIVADDGLQHLALGRDFEIAVIDERGLGNGWLLPAGPLREPPGRLARVDAVVAHNTDCSALALQNCYAMRTRLAAQAYALADRGRVLTLEELRARQRGGRLRIAAAAGIGVPQRFFHMLTAAGLTITETVPLPDHHRFDDDPFRASAADIVLITEKDAVKCEGVESLRRDPRIWVVPLVAQIPDTLVDRIVTRLRETKTTKATHGSQAA